MTKLRTIIIPASRQTKAQGLTKGLAAKAGITTTLAQINALYASIDVSDQEPFAAMARVGLKLVQVPL